VFQDLDKKLNTLVLHSSDVSEETDKCKRYSSLLKFLCSYRIFYCTVVALIVTLLVIRLYLYVYGDNYICPVSVWLLQHLSYLRKALVGQRINLPFEF